MVLKKGSRGDEVKQIQLALGLQADGIFGTQTENAVKNFGGINLCPVSVNYTFLRQDKPEVVMEFGEVQTYYEFQEDRKEFSKRLAREFEELCDKQQVQISSGNFDGYRYLFKQKLSWWRDIERRLKNIGMKDGNKQ